MIKRTSNARWLQRAVIVAALFVIPSIGFAKPPSSLLELGKETGNLIEKRELENGLDVIVLSDPSLPIVTVEVAVKNGAFTESAEYNGLSHLYEHMFFKANAELSSQEAFLERVRELGISFNGTTSTERVNYFFTLPSRNLKPGLEFMNNAITSPQFNPKEFKKEKQVVLGEIDRNESNPSFWFYRAFQEKLWYKYPSRKDALGTRESVKSATIEQMKTMKERYYIPNNSALMIAGDVDTEHAFSLAKKIFGSWERGPDPFEAHPVPEHPPLEEKKAVIVEKSVKVPTVQLSWHGPAVGEDSEGTYAADVLSFIVGQSTSKFQKRLVDNGPGLSASLSYYTQRTTGPISASVKVENGKVKKAVKQLVKEIYRLSSDNYFTDAELNNAKTILAVDDIYAREKTSGFAHTLTFWWATAGLDYYDSYIPSLADVTREQIREYVNRYLIDQPYVVGALLSPKTKKKLDLTPGKLKKITEDAIKELENEDS